MDPESEERRVDHQLQYVRGWAVGLPIALLVVLEASRWLGSGAFTQPTARWFILLSLIVVVGVAAEYGVRTLRQLHDRLVQQNRELLALHDASLTVVADLSLDSVLQKIVDQARELVGTKYGALSVIDDHARILSFVVSGIEPHDKAAIGPPPQGRGLLGVVLREGEHLRLTNIHHDPRSVGFPPHHPPMNSLLAVPIICTGPYRGNLYLSERDDGEPFDEASEGTLLRFANQAAIAIDNAYLHRQVRELAAARERMHIAHEMHDGVAQVLAFVNTKSQVVKEYLRQEKPTDAREHLDQLAQAAREVYEDVRAQILDLRTTSLTDKGLLESLEEHVQKWQIQTDIPVTLELPDELELQPENELQVLRILQEALTNVRKHARAKHVDVHLEITEGKLVAWVRDDGRGFEAERTVRSSNPRFGLTTMRERAQALGALLTVESEPERGTRVKFELPIPTRAKGD